LGFNAKVVLVSGAGSGMGRLAARNMAAQGATVAALDVNEQGLAETADGADSIRTLTVDVSDAAAVASAVETIERDMGAIERVYNAAAIMPLGRLMEQDTALIHKIMDVNYGGLVNIARAALPPMLERKRGDMILFASMAGWMPAIYCGAYNASKFAVVAFSEVLYHENRDSGVRFCCVCPPPVATPLLEQGRETVWPKTFDEAPPIEPQAVLDSIDASLDAGKFWVFPGKGTTFAWRLRRFIPEMIWTRMHKMEGC